MADQARAGGADPLSQSVQYLKGVGETRAKLFARLEIRTVRDLLYHFPRSYIDLSHPLPAASAPLGEECALRLRVLRKSPEQRIRGGLSLYKVLAADDTGAVTLTFFNAKYTAASLKEEAEYFFYGRLGGTLLRREMSAPQVFPLSARGLAPVYPLTAGLSSRLVASCVRQALELCRGRIDDPLPESLRQREHLCPLPSALESIHFPRSREDVLPARRRFIFEELFTLSLAMASVKGKNSRASALPVRTEDLSPFFSSLPFSPTGGQTAAIEDIRRDLARGVPMNRLIQGDVGCGKTLVVAAAVWMCCRQGFQCAMMAPTEILARQHFATMSRFLEPFGVKTVLLTGSLSKKEKDAAKALLASGEAGLCVGTHAVLTEDVAFQRLALAVTDEQHRFGVSQRAGLSFKGESPHVLVTSATPIPRTLALIVYGDLDVSLIREMPKGRLPVKTYAIGSDKRQRAFGFLRRHLDEGYQAYIVCPLVEAGEADLGLRPAAEYAKELAEGPFAGYRVGLLHGRMRPKEKDAVMERFQSGDIQLLVSTTVVEVGVDVPNAVIMMVEDAHRFGLSQLHQLRGRVGRGRAQSYCILVSDAKSDEARARLGVMCRTNDGFQVAEQDLAQRGPGDFFGSRQHGLPELHTADMKKDLDVLMLAQEEASRLLREAPGLRGPEYAPLRRRVRTLLEKVGERLN